MLIIYDESKKTFKLDTPDSSYLIRVYEDNHLLNLYYGKYFPDTYIPGREAHARCGGFSPVYSQALSDNSHFSPDAAPMEYGTNGAGDFRISALSVCNASGDSVTDIYYVDHKIYKGKPAIPDQPSTYVNNDDEADTLEIYAHDKVTDLYVTLYYTVFADHDVITRRVRVENRSENVYELERAFSMCLDLPSMEYDMITLYGRHNKERSLERRPLAHGLQGIESKRGASSHTQNPFVAICSHGANEDYGDAYGFNLVYSGNFSALAECDFAHCTRFIMGINPTDFTWHLNPGDYFDTPEVVMVYSSEGLGKMSRTFHRFYNSNLVRGKYKTEKRPLLINSWEAMYFDFDADKLVNFAKEAKKLGIELVVMDDGWFGKRNNDDSSLGDWFTNEEKLVGGLGSLIKRVNDEGMKFGIWYEPEMISPDSDLFRAHPDWCVHVEGREPLLGRNQYVLDVSRKDVRDNIWQQMYDILSTNNIEYLKWDFNRNISDAGSAILPKEQKKEFFHRFVLGTYDLMNRLVETFPNILFENCSGGGGRFDPAMLYYSPQIWASDITDPIERLTVQFGTSMCYPASTMGAHVSACRRTGFITKGHVAMWGTFGYELDPAKLTDEDKEIIKSQVESYHKNYDLIRQGDLYRLVTPFENAYHTAWEIVSPDKKRVMFTFVSMRFQLGVRYTIKLRGLDPDKYYQREGTDEIYSGAALMYAGFRIDPNTYSNEPSCVDFFNAID